jgi:hypothetical protein
MMSSRMGTLTSRIHLLMTIGSMISNIDIMNLKKETKTLTSMKVSKTT